MLLPPVLLRVLPIVPPFLLPMVLLLRFNCLSLLGSLSASLTEEQLDSEQPDTANTELAELNFRVFIVLDGVVERED